MSQNIESTIFVTADGSYSDIDIYACSVAYAELLRFEGKDAVAVVNTRFTESIPDYIARLDVEFIDQNKVDMSKAEKIVILDRSDVDGLKKHIDITKIIELYDHHTLYEKFWKKQLGKDSHIEHVGSCATLIWEEIKRRGFAKNISKSAIILLYSAIISNTLDLKAGVTTKRDIAASKETKTLAKVDQSFSQKYFNSVTENIKRSPLESLIKDTKITKMDDYEIAIGQLELWDTKGVVQTLQKFKNTYLPGFDKLPWFITIASISSGSNTLICRFPELRKKLAAVLGIEWIDSDVVEIPKLLLRKEIIKLLN